MLRSSPAPGEPPTLLCPLITQRPSSDEDVAAESGNAIPSKRSNVSLDTHPSHSPVSAQSETEEYEIRSFQSGVHPKHWSQILVPKHNSRGQATHTIGQSRDKPSPKSGKTALLDPSEGDPASFPESALSAKRRKKVTRVTGWRAGAVTCTCSAAVVLLVNSGLTIWATHSVPIQDGIGTLIDGNCSRIKSWGIWLHLAINVLGTLLLGASNYCMQYLTSPTREEVDKAHAKRRWLDIGVPSYRNLFCIPWDRLFLWSLLGLSSVPLHLMYNSAVFEALSANEYDVLVVTEGFLSGAPWEIDSARGSSFTVRRLQSNLKAFKRLENVECMKAYGSRLQAGKRNLLAISSSSGNGSSLLGLTSSRPGGVSDPTRWICAFLPPVVRGDRVLDCDVGNAVKHANTWEIMDKPIKYCMSEMVTEHCKLQFSRTIMIVVIICNLVKVCCMLYAILRKSGESLVTTGDAVASFLERPDTTTGSMCLMDKADITSRAVLPYEERPAICPKIWLPRRLFWFNAPSVARWCFCVLLCIVALAGTGALLQLGLGGIRNNLSNDLRSLWRMGFGKVNINSMISPASNPDPRGDILRQILLANAPQVVLSFLYLMYNGLYTCMLQGDEWSRYAQKRRALRVTSPVGKQRSTYYLTLPYTYAGPLLFCSGLMHWLVSQSIFLVRITIYAADGTENIGDSITTCGYSCIAIIFVIIVGSIMLLVGVGTGFRRFHAGIPLAFSCSAAISAACHPPPGDGHAAVLPVMWGVVKGDDKAVGHCSFTSHEVVPPVEGRLYAGTMDEWSK